MCYNHHHHRNSCSWWTSIAEMDSSKISEECSSSESGWTTYLASPDIEHDDYAENEEDDNVDEDARLRQKGYKKQAQIEEEAADSDDSMASDASSGPSDQRCSYGYLGRNNGFSHAGSNNGRTSVAKKLNQKEEKKKQIKGEKEKSGNKANSGGRLKKL